MTAGIGYNIYRRAKQKPGRFALRAPSSTQYSLWAKRPPHGDLRPAVWLDTDGNHVVGAFFVAPGIKMKQVTLKCSEGCGREKTFYGYARKHWTCIDCSVEKQRRKGILRSMASRTKKQQVLSEQGSLKCEKCGKSYTRQGSLSTHHKIKLEDGGTNDLDNLELLCFECHKKAHNGKW